MVDGPLIVQSDKTLLLEVDHPDAEAARRAIAPFAELERAPEHVHTYRLTPLGLWNARAAGHDAEQVINTLITYSRYAVPHSLLMDVADAMDRYGRLSLTKDGDQLVLHSTDRPVLEEVLRHKTDPPVAGGMAGLLQRAGAPVRAWPAQAASTQDRLARRGLRRLRRWGSTPDLTPAERLGTPPPPATRRGRLLGRG